MTHPYIEESGKKRKDEKGVYDKVYEILFSIVFAISNGNGEAEGREGDGDFNAAMGEVMMEAHRLMGTGNGESAQWGCLSPGDIS